MNRSVFRALAAAVLFYLLAMQAAAAEFPDTPTLMAGIGMASYTLQEGETYVFQNTQEQDYDIRLNGYADYAVYDADGTLKAYQWKQSNATVSVPAKGRVTATAVNSNGLTCSAIADFFTAEKQSDPAMLRASLTEGQSYQYTNTSGVELMIFVDGVFDYVLYEADGSIKDYNWSRWGGSITVPAGGSAAVTSVNNDGLSCAAVYTEFTGKEQNNPAMLRAYLVEGEGYEYINNGGVEYRLFTSGQFDYVLYEADGSVKGYDWGQSGTTITVPAGGKVVVNATDSNGLSCAAVYKYFTIQRNESPEGYLRLKPFDTWSIKNTSGREQSFYCNTITDCTVYGGDGSVVSSGFQNAGTISLPASYSMELRNPARVYAVISENSDLTYSRDGADDGLAYVSSVLIQSDDETAADVSDLAEKDVNVGIALEDKTDAPTVADVFLAIYDRKGYMVDLQTWEIDFSQPLSFFKVKSIPEGTEVATIKLMIIDENMAPVMAAQNLA